MAKRELSTPLLLDVSISTATTTRPHSHAPATPSIAAALRLAESKLPQNDALTNRSKRSIFEDEASESKLIPLTINVGSHFRLRDGKLMRALGLKNGKHKTGKDDLHDSLLHTVQEQAGSFFVTKFGTGMSLYLKMLRFLAISFFLQGLFQLPALIFYASGHGDTSSASDDSDKLQGLGLSDFTLMNVRQTLPATDATLGSSPSSSSSSLSPEQGNLWFGLCQSDMFTLLAYLDVVSIGVFTVCSLVLIKKQREFDKDMDLINTTPADFTVCVTGLPANGEAYTASDVAAHFERLLLSRLSSREIQEGQHKVAEVVLHQRCRVLIERGRRIRDEEEAERATREALDHARRLQADGASDSDTSASNVKKLDKTLREVQKRLRELVRAQEAETEAERDVVCAFVTFQEDEGKNLCLAIDEEPSKVGWCSGVGGGACRTANTPDPLKLFQGVHLLDVERAREPDDIIYENLETRVFETVIGRAISALVATFFLALAMTTIFSVSLEGKRISSPPTDDCDESVDYTKELAKEGGLEKDCYCGKHAFTDPSFCKQVLEGAMYKLLASFMTTAINIALAAIIRRTASLQLWRSRSSEESAVVVWTFLAQFLNTAVVLVLVNLNWKKWLSSWSVLDQAPDDGFGYKWYLAVAIPVLTNMITNSMMPHMILYARKVANRFQIWLFASKMKTQEQLNALVGNKVKFNLAERFAFILTVCFICNMFSAVVPVMPFIVSWTFTVLYRADKYNLLRYYTNVVETKFDSQMAMLTAAILPMSACLHCIFSIIVWSDPWLQPYSIAVPDDESTSLYLYRLTLPNTFPLTVAFVATFVICTCVNSEHAFNTLAPKCLKPKEQQELEDNPSWAKACEDAKANGETMAFSYEIAKQATYAALFGRDVESGAASPEHVVGVYYEDKVDQMKVKVTSEGMQRRYSAPDELAKAQFAAIADTASSKSSVFASCVEDEQSEEPEPEPIAVGNPLQQDVSEKVDAPKSSTSSASATISSSSSAVASSPATSEEGGWVPCETSEAGSAVAATESEGADSSRGARGDSEDDVFFDATTGYGGGKERMNSATSEDSRHAFTPSGSFEKR